MLLLAMGAVSFIMSRELFSFFWQAATAEQQWAVVIQFDHFVWEPHLDTAFYTIAPVIVVAGIFALGWLWGQG